MKRGLQTCLSFIVLAALTSIAAYGESFFLTPRKYHNRFAQNSNFSVSSNIANFNFPLSSIDSFGSKEPADSITMLSKRKVEELNSKLKLFGAKHRSVYNFFNWSSKNKMEENVIQFDINLSGRNVILPDEKLSKKGLTSGQLKLFGRSEYRNPLKVKLGDPYVMYDKHSKRYYMYGTNGGAKDGFVTYSSTDLVNWNNEGQVYFGNTQATWGIGAFWAPEVYPLNGKYYIFYSAQSRYNPNNETENFKIGVAISDKPTGPFKDLTSRPLFDPGYPVIDANVFFDTDGRVYLYYSRCCYKHAVDSEIAEEAKKKGWFKEIEESWVYGVELKPDFSSVIGQPVLLLRPPATLNDTQAEWESRSVTSREANRRWTEGSFTFKKDGIYYTMYSANHFAGKNYAVGYATANHPLGPYKKALDNPILQQNITKGGNVSGTGHNSIAYSPDGKQMFCVYHGRTTPTGKERVVFIDRMEVTKGKITVFGPNTDKQPYPLKKSKVK